VPFCIVCLLSESVCQQRRDTPALHIACKYSEPRHKTDFGRSPKRSCRRDSPTGWPKSDCRQNKPNKCGATMAAKHRALARNSNALNNNETMIGRAKIAIAHTRQRKIHDAGTGTANDAETYVPTVPLPANFKWSCRQSPPAAITNRMPEIAAENSACSANFAPSVAVK
jgi:hypothetical protein